MESPAYVPKAPKRPKSGVRDEKEHLHRQSSRRRMPSAGPSARREAGGGNGGLTLTDIRLLQANLNRSRRAQVLMFQGKGGGPMGCHPPMRVRVKGEKEEVARG